MPSSTSKQHRFMEAVAHGMKPPGGKGPSVAVAKEFVAADKGTKPPKGHEHLAHSKHFGAKPASPKSNTTPQRDGLAKATAGKRFIGA